MEPVTAFPDGFTAAWDLLNMEGRSGERVGYWLPMASHWLPMAALQRPCSSVTGTAPFLWALQV